MKPKKRIVIIGATSAIAEQCARLWAKENPSEMVLVGRNQEKIERVASDLKVRAPDTTITCIKADFLDPNQIQTLVEQIYKAGNVDIALIAHGSLPNQEACQCDLNLCREAMDVNGISPVLFAEAFATHMQKTNSGTLAVIGSVAGDRGRKSNYVYGAAKGLVTRYVQGLQHRLANTDTKVVLIKPGPTDTPMTAHLKQSGAKLAAVDRVASEIVRGIANGQMVVYVPKIWNVIMMVIRHLPHFVFRRMDI
uniref:Short-chain dehydrogenase/reductase SDR n=1 Tax=Dechloromonas aromatica (strain RCB) TaxID=159087 RepID=Q47FC6_DECAR